MDMLHSVVLVEIVDSDTTVLHGSGVIIEHKNNTYWIITANHVVDSLVENPTRKILIRFDIDSNTPYTASVLKTDKNQDLALLSVKIIENLPTASVCSYSPNFFDRVYSIGFPLKAPLLVSEGIVSNPFLLLPTGPGMYLYTTAPIAPGDSGGGIFTYQQGEYCLAGITDRGSLQADFINLAITTFNLRHFLEDTQHDG